MIDLARIGRLFGGADERATGQILGNSASLVGSVAMTSGVGFVYWFVAALLFPQAEIGIAAASISAMMLLASLGTFGLGTLLIAEIPRHHGREVGLIATAMISAGAVGIALGVTFAVGVAAANPEFRPLAASPWIVSLFSLGVGLTAGAAVVDVALLALLRSDLQFARTAVFALVKLGLLVAASIVVAHSIPHVTIIATWVIGLLVSIALLGVYASLKGHLRRIRPLEFEALRDLRGDALRHHALNLALAAPDWSMPILVTAILTAADSGAFFIAWMMAGVALFIPASLSQSLNAVVARDPGSLPTNLRLTLRLSLAAGVAVWVMTIIVGPFVLSLLGRGYFEAAPALIILALGIFPVTIKVHYVTMGRLEDTLGETTWLSAAGAVVELGLAAAGGILAGLTGVAIGVLIGLILQAIVMAPRIRRGLRSGFQPARRASSSTLPG